MPDDGERVELDATTLRERLGDVEDVMDAIGGELGPFFQVAGEVGINLLVLMHSFDPLTGHSHYNVFRSGDVYALMGATRHWLNGEASDG